MKRLLSMLCLSTIVACSSQEDLKVSEAESPHQYASAYVTILDTCRDVTIQTVENIARSFSMGQTLSRSTAEKEILNIQSVNGEDGTALFYVVNYKSNQGFVVMY